MQRTMVMAGLALAVSAGAASAADFGKGEIGKSRERAAHERRFDRGEVHCDRDGEGRRTRHAFSIFKGAYDGRCKLVRVFRPAPIWRGYPQSR